MSLVSVILIAGCIISPQTPITGDLSVELKIHDSLPKSLTLQKDGTLIFTEGDKTDQISLSSEEVESLKQIIIDNNFFTLKEKYEDRNLMDGIGHTITITIGDESHSVYCYGECPEGFSNVLGKIKSLWTQEIQYSGFA